MAERALKSRYDPPAGAVIDVGLRRLDIRAQVAKPRSRSHVSKTKRPRISALALIGLSLAAITVGVFLIQIHIDYTTGVNTVASACHNYSERGCSVTAGRFGSIFGVPVAAIGVAGAFAILASAAMSLRVAETEHNPFPSVLLGLGAFTVLASIVMGLFSLLESSFCPFCVAWYGINIATFAAAWVGRHRDGTWEDVLDDLLGNAGLVPLFTFGATLVLAVFGYHARLDAQQQDRDAEIEAKAPEIAADILEKNNTFASGPVDTLIITDNPTKVFGGATEEQADVVIVEFGDFECPFCKKLWFFLDEYLETTDRSIRVHFAHFPLNASCNPGINDLHQHACQAALASVCADRQDKFWAYGGLVFEDQDSLDRDDLVDHARTLGLDVDRFETCLDDPTAMQQIEHDIEIGAASKLTGTPTFFVNGYPVVGAYPPPVFEEIVRQILEHDRSTRAQ